jgi:uncharacterized repeat protein (TIGR03803 family)
MLLLLLLLIMPVSGAQGAVVLTTLHSFTGGNDGASPQAALVQGSDGYFYGTTSLGGANRNALGGYGTVFKLSTDGALTTLYAFGSVQDANGAPLDGANPCAALVQGSDGYFYGTTREGMVDGCGTVFKISTNGVLTSLYSFTGGNDGEYPNGLVQGSDGNFYGTTSEGGVTNTYPRYGFGTVFKISPVGALTTLYIFTGTNGAYPEAGLVQGSDGNFYGTTLANGWLGDGAFGAGTVFKISTNGALTTLHSFTGGNDGASPQAALVQGSDGSFYGTTAGDYWYGGTNYGTVFRLTIVPEPQLTLIPSGPYMILTWPTNYAGFTLQSTTNLGSSAVWTTNSPPPVVIGGQNVIINTMSGTQQFFRLSQ